MRTFCPNRRKFSPPSRVIAWFKTLPLYLDLGEVRVVHACWHDPSIGALRTSLSPARPLPDEFFVGANTHEDPLYRAGDTVLKGPRSLSAPTGHTSTRMGRNDPTLGSAGGTRLRPRSESWPRFPRIVDARWRTTPTVAGPATRLGNTLPVFRRRPCPLRPLLVRRHTACRRTTHGVLGLQRRSRGSAGCISLGRRNRVDRPASGGVRLGVKPPQWIEPIRPGRQPKGVPMRANFLSPQFIAQISSYTRVIVTPLMHSGSRQTREGTGHEAVGFRSRGWGVQPDRGAYRLSPHRRAVPSTRIPHRP